GLNYRYRPWAQAFCAAPAPALSPAGSASGWYKNFPAQSGSDRPRQSLLPLHALRVRWGRSLALLAEEEAGRYSLHHTLRDRRNRSPLNPPAVRTSGSGMHPPLTGYELN